MEVDSIAELARIGSMFIRFRRVVVCRDVVCVCCCGAYCRCEKDGDGPKAFTGISNAFARRTAEVVAVENFMLCGIILCWYFI